MVDAVDAAKARACPRPRSRGSGGRSGSSRIWSTSFKLSPDPQFIDKVRDIVGLYLNPPDAAVVLCVDEKSQIQALDRTAPMLPLLPACIQDANYGVRWLKSKAAQWNGDPSQIGIYGSSSGGHVAELLGMRPHDPRYNAIPLPEAPKLDATVAFIAMRSPISDPYARFQQAEKMKREPMMKNNTTFFKPWESDLRGQPAADSRAQGEGHTGADAADAGRARRQRAAGGAGEIRGDLQGGRRRIQLHIFEGCEHEWVAKPGPQTDKAREMVKAFIARQLKTT